MQIANRSSITKEEELQVRRMLINYFEPSLSGTELENCMIWRLTGGMNNSTYLIHLKGKRYVLRMYNSHQDKDKVKYEHAILNSLTIHKQAFVYPQLVQTLENTTFTHHEGKIGALFHYQEGSNAVRMGPSQYLQLGQKAGQVTLALSRITVPLAPVSFSACISTLLQIGSSLSGNFASKVHSLSTATRLVFSNPASRNQGNSRSN